MSGAIEVDWKRSMHLHVDSFKKEGGLCLGAGIGRFTVVEVWTLVKSGQVWKLTS